MNAIPDLGDDNELLRVLGQALVEDMPIPHERVDAAIEMAFQLRTVEDQLGLVTDSLTDSVIGFRSGDDDTRSLRYENAVVAIELDLDQSAGNIVGQLLPPAARTVEMESPTGRTPVVVDDVGRFQIDLTERQVRFRIGDHTETFVTPWIFR